MLTQSPGLQFYTGNQLNGSKAPGYERLYMHRMKLLPAEGLLGSPRQHGPAATLQFCMQSYTLLYGFCMCMQPLPAHHCIACNNKGTWMQGM